MTASGSYQTSDLSGKVAVVAGATRGSGRGIARMLGATGATVYCTGRGSRDKPSSEGYCAGRPETIEETAEMVDAAGGTGIPVRVDHRDETQVAALFKRVKREQERLDVLVNIFWGGPPVTQWGGFWKHSLQSGRELFEAVWPHVMTCRHATPMMVERKSGLIIQITEGDALYYRHNVFYDLGRIAEMRLAYALAEELAPHGVTALALTPGFMRTEAILQQFGVTEANWREAAEKNPQAKRYGFIASESPCFVGRAVVALAADPDVARKSGALYSVWGLAEEYGFTDLDGTQPNLGKRLARDWSDLPGGPPRTAVRWEVDRTPELSTQAGARR